MEKPNIFASKLANAGELRASANPRARRANLSNAKHLIGDFEDLGDPDGPYGDLEEGPFGDVSQESSLITTYDALIGDAFEVGGPSRARQVFDRLPKAAKIGLVTAAGAGAAFGALKAGKAVQAAIRRNRARKQSVRAAQDASARRTTVANSVYARRHLKKIAPTQMMGFYQVEGASLVKYPIAPTHRFPMRTLTWCLDQQSNTSPFVADVVNATQPGGPGTNYIMNAPGPAGGAFYPFIYVIIGATWLQAPPGINFRLTATLPLVNNGTLSISAEPFTFQLGKTLFAKIAIVPWTLVAAQPVFTSGFYSAANPVNVQVEGSIPSPTAISLTVPGSLHNAIIGLRNAGI